MLVKSAYLEKPHVKGFLAYLSQVIDGEIPINFLVSFGRRSRVYKNFDVKMENISGVDIEVTCHGSSDHSFLDDSPLFRG